VVFFGGIQKTLGMRIGDGMCLNPITFTSSTPKNTKISHTTHLLHLCSSIITECTTQYNVYQLSFITALFRNFFTTKTKRTRSRLSLTIYQPDAIFETHRFWDSGQFCSRTTTTDQLGHCVKVCGSTSNSAPCALWFWYLSLGREYQFYLFIIEPYRRSVLPALCFSHNRLYSRSRSILWGIKFRSRWSQHGVGRWPRRYPSGSTL